jgi:hypothetical protein
MTRCGACRPFQDRYSSEPGAGSTRRSCCHPGAGNTLAGAADKAPAKLAGASLSKIKDTRQAWPGFTHRARRSHRADVPKPASEPVLHRRDGGTGSKQLKHILAVEKVSRMANSRGVTQQVPPKSYATPDSSCNPPRSIDETLNERGSWSRRRPS